MENSGWIGGFLALSCANQPLYAHNSPTLCSPYIAPQTCHPAIIIAALGHMTVKTCWPPWKMLASNHVLGPFQFPKMSGRLEVFEPYARRVHFQPALALLFDSQKGWYKRLPSTHSAWFYVFGLWSSNSHSLCLLYKNITCYFNIVLSPRSGIGST